MSERGLFKSHYWEIDWNQIQEKRTVNVFSSPISCPEKFMSHPLDRILQDGFFLAVLRELPPHSPSLPEVHFMMSPRTITHSPPKTGLQEKPGIKNRPRTRWGGGNSSDIWNVGKEASMGFITSTTEKMRGGWKCRGAVSVEFLAPRLEAGILGANVDDSQSSSYGSRCLLC